MDILDYFFNLDYSYINFFPRKYKIEKSSKTLLFGAPSSGKSFIALDYLNSLEKNNSLYIDLQDPKLKFNPISLDELESFILDNQIETLILDHYKNRFLKRDIAVKELIVISQIEHLELKDFKKVRIFPLDFEEFFSFQKRSLEKYIFNLFLKRGTLTQLGVQLDIPKERLFQQLLESKFDSIEQNILIVLAHFNGSNVTTHQIYTYAKRKFRVSKDSIYKKIAEFEKRGVLFFIEDIRVKNLKKMVLFDFALASYLSLSQKFLKQFDSMIVLSLIKHNIKFKSFENISYLTSKYNLIIPAPFESEESAFNRAKVKIELFREYNIKSIYIITVSTQYKFSIDNICFEAMPFYEWVLINDEL